VHVFISSSRQLHPLLYPVRQLHHVCRVDAEEDVVTGIKKYSKNGNESAAKMETIVQ